VIMERKKRKSYQVGGVIFNTLLCLLISLAPLPFSWPGFCQEPPSATSSYYYAYYYATGSAKATAISTKAFVSQPSLSQDIDDDGIEDLNDNCPQLYNPDQGDADSDGVGNGCDNCLLVPNQDQADENANGIGDACEECPDADYDSVCDWADNCPYVPNPDQIDWDEDGRGDACDTPPDLLCPDNLTTEAEHPLGTSATDEEIAHFLTSVKVFGQPGTTLTNDAPAVFRIGTTTVTFTATDPEGGLATCQAQVTVQDTQPPRITCPENITVEAMSPEGTPATDPQIQAFLSAVSAVDATDSVLIEVAPSIEVFPLGTTTVTFIARDDYGHESSCEAMVIVQDTTPPVLTLPHGISVEQEQPDGTPATSAQIAAFLAQASATDLVDPEISVRVGSIPQVFPPGITTVTFTATDRAGNTATGWSTVEVAPASPQPPAAPTMVWSGEVTIDHDLTIPENEYLEIKPGSLIRCLGNFSLVIRGPLYAVGTAESPILFTAASREGWRGLTVSSSKTSIRYCHLEKVMAQGEAALTIQNAAPQEVSDNLLRHNSIGLLLQNSGGRYEHNTLIENSLAAIWIDNPTPSAPLILKHNLIAKNELGLIIVNTDPNITLSENNFQAQAAYHLKNLSATSLSATYNWWGQASPLLQTDSDPAVRIGKLIYDREDNHQCGQVDYTPLLLLPHGEAPIPYVSGIRFLPTESSTTIEWDELPLPDIQGYRIYVQEESGIKEPTTAVDEAGFRLLKQVEKNTSAILDNFSPINQYAVVAYDRDGNEGRYSIPPKTPTGFSLLSVGGGIKILFDPAKENVLGYWLFFGTLKDRLGPGLNPLTCRKMFIAAGQSSSLTLAYDITWYLSLAACDWLANMSLPTPLLSFTHTPAGILSFQKNLDSASAETGCRYQMISIPLQPLDREISHLFTQELGQYDPTSWRLFRYDPDRKTYLEFPDISTMSAGESVWIISREKKTITFYGQATSTEKNYRIPLKPGWNQIGNPFHFPVGWEDVYRLNSGIVDPRLYQYQGLPSSPYIQAGQLMPGEGYWVKNILDREADLLIPPISQKLPVSSARLKGLSLSSSYSPSLSPQQADQHDLPPPPPQELDQGASSRSGALAGSCFLAFCNNPSTAKLPHAAGDYPHGKVARVFDWLSFWLYSWIIPVLGSYLSLALLLSLYGLGLLIIFGPLLFLVRRMQLFYSPEPTLRPPVELLARLRTHPKIMLFICFLLTFFALPLWAEAAEKINDHIHDPIQQGIRKLKDQQYKEAASLFLEAIKTTPSEPKAHLYLALAYYQQNMLDEAQQEISKALSLGLDSEYGELARKYQALIEQKKKKLFLSLSASIQYDDNILLTPYSSEAEPIDRTDWKNIFVLTTRARPFSGKQNMFLLAGYDFYQSLNHEYRTYNIQGHIGSITAGYQKAAWRLECNFGMNYFFLDSRDYLKGQEATASCFFEQSATRQRELSFGWQGKTFFDQKIEDTVRYLWGIGEIFSSQDRRKQLRLGYGYSRERAEPTCLSFQEHELSAIWRRDPFLYQTQLILKGSYTIRDYLHPDPEYGWREREDDRRTVSAAVLKKLSRGFNLSLQYSKTVNHSNLNHQGLDKRYRRNLYTAGIIKQF